MKYNDRNRKRQTFILTGQEHRGRRAGNERLVCHVNEDTGLLAVWGETDVDMLHIQKLEKQIKQSGFPIIIECDWIKPDSYEAENFGHRYWVWQTDHFKIIT